MKTVVKTDRHAVLKTEARRTLDELIDRVERGQLFGKFAVEFAANKGVIHYVTEKVEKTTK